MRRSEKRSEATNRDGGSFDSMCCKQLRGKGFGGLLVARKEKINFALKRLEHLSFMC
jgi:hypothetical protein